MYFKKKTLKEKKDAAFFDFDEIVKRRVIQIKKFKDEKVFNHFISDKNFKHNANNINDTSISSKQSVIKLLSNLDAKGCKNAIEYIIRNSDSIYATNEKGEQVSAQEIMKNWSKDFTGKKNAKEAWHLCFSIDENFTQRNVEILQEAVNEVMRANFYEYKYISVIHTHQNNPHIHIVLNKNNIYTKEKLHFNGKGEIKEFFNDLREQFSVALNIRGLQYHNKYKVEKDLVREKAKLEKFEFQSGKDLALEIAHSMEKISKKQSLYENKITFLRGEIKNLYANKKDLLAKLNEIKNQEPIPYKKLGAAFKAIKENNAQIKNFNGQIQTYQKDLKELGKVFKELNWERSKFETKIGTLERKRQFVDFMQSNLNQRASKTDFQTIFEVKRDILLNENAVDEKILEHIKASLIVSKLLGKKNNAFELIKSYKELEYNLNALKKSNAEPESKKEFQQRLEGNQKIILELCADRFDNLDKNLSLENPKTFQVNEFERLSAFLNKDSEAKIKALRQRLEMSEISKDDKAIKAPKIEPNIVTNAQTSTTSETKKPANAAKSVAINDTSKLDELTRQAFIAWLIQKRQLKNVKFYQNLFTEQLKNNEMKNFKDLYKEFSSHSQNIGSFK